MEGGKDDIVEEGGDGRGEEGACEDELDTTEDVVSVKEVVSIVEEEVSIVEGVSEVVSEDIVGGACTNDGDSNVQSGGKVKGRAQGELDPIAARFYNMQKNGHRPRPHGPVQTGSLTTTRARRN